jgi:hypothetical protein
VKLILDSFLNHLPHPDYFISPATITRLTKNSNIPGIGLNRLTKVEHISHPKTEFVKTYGRCNIPGSPVFYGSFNFITIMKEMRVKKGDIVTHSRWRLKSNATSLKVFPIFFLTESSRNVHNSLSLDIKRMHQNYINDLQESEKEYMNISMELIARIFAKDVDIDNHYDYLLSAYLSNNILSNPEAQYDAIMYPSVQDGLETTNLAITPMAMSKFEPEEVTHDIFLGIRNGGGMFNGIYHTHRFDVDNGLILWDD